MKFGNAFRLTTAVSVLLLLVSCQHKSEKLLLAGSGWNKVVILDKDSKQIEWEHFLEAGENCNSVNYTSDGNILYSYTKGAKLITKDHKVIWDIAAPKGTVMHTANILPNGDFLLAYAGHPATIMEVSKDGEVLTTTTYETGIESAHSQFRQVHKNSRGNYMIPLFGRSEVSEISPKGELIKSIKVGGTPFAALELKNGNFLVACGDGHAYKEINFDTEEIIREVKANDIEGVSLFFVAELLPTAQGGEYICNWQGHDSDSDTSKCPQLIEVDKNGKMIWSLNDNVTFGMISAISKIE